MQTSVPHAEELEDTPSDLPHRLSWRVAGLRPGAHKGAIPGSGSRFRDIVPLIDAPDARRIDLHASLRDPWGGIHVRRFNQKSAVTAYALIDLSASMGFIGETDRMLVGAKLVAALAASLRRIGDAFGVIACNDDVVHDMSVHATRSRAGERTVMARLSHYRPRSHASAYGLVEGAKRLSGKKRLVFVISDFAFPDDLVRDVFSALATHDVIPIVLEDPIEIEGLPNWRLVALKDAESGRSQLVLMRPELKRRWREARDKRLSNLRDMALSFFGVEPFIVSGDISWDKFGDYLLTGRA